jgi:hypothetical protein
MTVIHIEGVKIVILESSVSRTSRGVSAYFEADFPGENHVRCIGLYDDPYIVQDILPNAIPEMIMTVSSQSVVCQWKM